MYTIKDESGVEVELVRETGSITAHRLEITETAAGIHVWTSAAPDDSVELTHNDKRWTVQPFCGKHHMQKSAAGKCWSCEDEG
jgi:hypothetical protein